MFPWITLYAYGSIQQPTQHASTMIMEMPSDITFISQGYNS